MALDLTNRDPKDPNGVASLDKSFATEAWVKDGDWSQIYLTESEAKKAGANNKIRVATAVLNDGRKYNVVIGADGNVISEVGDSTGYDAAQQRSWQQGQDDAKPPGGLPTRTINGQVMQWNPSTRAYDIPSGTPAPTTPARTPEQRRADDANATTAETNAAEAIRIRNESQWNADPANRDKGGSGRYETHADRDARRDKEKKEAEAANKPTVKIEDDGKGGTVAISVFPDGTIKTAPVTGVAGKPNQVKGPDGVTYEKGPDGTYKPLAGIPNPNTDPDPTDMPAPTFVIGDAAKDLRDFDTYLAGKIGTGPGKITQAKADQLREQRRKLWEVALGEQQGIVNTQRTAYSDQVSARGQTLQDQGNRRSNATSIANQATSSVFPYADKLGAGTTGENFLGALRYARDSAQDFVTGTGANVYTPEVQMGPALTTINNARIPVPGQTPAYATTNRPNAIGLGNGVVPPPAPAAPPSQAAAATAAAQAAQRAASGGVAEPPPAVNPGPPRPTAGEPGGPPLAAGPVLGDPPPASIVPAGTTNPGPVPGQDASVWTPPQTPVPPIPGGAPYSPQMGSVPPGTTGDGSTVYDPLDTPPPSQPGDPTWNTYRPVPGQVAPPDPAFPQSMIPTAQPGFLSAMRPGSQPAYDPTPSVQAMIDDPEWDNAAVAEAYRQMYGREMPLQRTA